MPSTIVGMRTTDYVSSSLIKRDVFEAIYNFKPYQTPVTQYFLANRQAKLRTGNFKFEIQEDVLFPHLDSLGAAITGGGTTETLTLTSGYHKLYDVLRNVVAGENYLVTTAPTTTSVPVTKIGTGNITATAVQTGGNEIINIGSAYPEGTAGAVAMSTVSTFPYNYCQIMKQAVHMSGTQTATENYGGDDWINQRMKATEEFKLMIERAFFFGVRYQGTTAGAYNRKTSGLIDASGMGISDTSQFVGTDFAGEDFFFKTYCKNLFAKGTKEKTLYCGADALLGIGDYSKVKQHTFVQEEEYGIDIRVILTPFGRAKLVWHPLLEGAYANWVFGVDLDTDFIKYRFLSANGVNRDIQYDPDIHTPGTDEKKAQYLAEIGFHIAGGGQGVHRILYPGASA